MDELTRERYGPAPQREGTRTQPPPRPADPPTLAELVHRRRILVEAFRPGPSTGPDRAGLAIVDRKAS